MTLKISKIPLLLIQRSPPPWKCFQAVSIHPAAEARASLIGEHL
jgi:hypothetical protein